MQEGNDVSEEMVLRARERKERSIYLDCKWQFYKLLYRCTFQCLGNEFKLLFMRAFFPVIEGFSYFDQENSV